MLKYKFDYKLTYRENFNTSPQNTTDTLYRKDIIEVFDMRPDFMNNFDEQIFFKKLSDKANEIYKSLEYHQQLDRILKKIEESVDLPFKLDKDVIFLYLFRYDLFYLFHKCLQDFNIYAEITKENYNLLLKNI
tara:strand:- start:1614 stop:2012 length:399 start_codon:yes stop_codon:yes gene_type:complete